MDTTDIHDFIDAFLAAESKQKEIDGLVAEVTDRTQVDGTLAVAIGDGKTVFFVPASVLLTYFASQKAAIDLSLQDIVAPFKSVKGKPKK